MMDKYLNYLLIVPWLNSILLVLDLLTSPTSIRGDQLPEQIIIGVVEQTAFNGDVSLNALNFQNFDIREASLIVNGVHEPTELYKLNANAGDKVDMFANFVENTGISTGIEHLINVTDFIDMQWIQDQ